MPEKLLAGPILRRTTKNRICVWLASREPLSIRLTITDPQEKALGQSDLDDLKAQHAQLGQNLHVYLLQARSGEKEFPLDTLLYYKLDEIDSQGNPQAIDLQHLAYGALPSPSFFIPSKLNHLLHGSCRKPHGGFNPEKQSAMPDALSHGHRLLEKTHGDLTQRPPILLLTGDQIYADDVAISLLALLRQKSTEITGRHEMLPLVDSPSLSDASLTTRLDPLKIPLHGRKQILKERYKISSTGNVDKKSGFSSGESENHLFSFGEFAAMYIYAFGNIPAWEPIWDWQALQDIGVTDPKEAEKAWQAQKKPLQVYHQTLGDIRKLLANISTYMIFDDHDVTDDWNITGNWYDSVRDSPLGRRIVSNALAAYWAFQAWGNDPDNFDKDLILTITQHLSDEDSDKADRYDLHTWKSRGWGFSIATEPPIIAIDSRTQRQYENKYYPAVLLDRYALDWLRVEWAKLKTGQDIDENTCPLLIATTPVMGFSTIEFIQQLGLWLAGLIESWKPIRYLEKLADQEGFLIGWMVNQLDAESWSSNKEGFVAFMYALRQRMGIKRCAFLSGDVHYAFTAKAQFKYQGRQLDCIQFTSSSLYNQPDAKQSHFLKDAANHGTGIKTHQNWALLPDQRWSAEVRLLEASNENLRLTAECNLGLIEFKEGLPIKHTLLTGDGDLIYLLN